MSPYSVTVSNIAPATTETHLNDFFTFCGKIQSIDFKETEPKTAVVHFEKPSAAKTALMLNGGTLDGSHLTVHSEEVHPDEDNDSPHTDGVPFHQSDKPRAGIAAEYLAKGYTLSDSILQRAIDMDNKQGISKRFLSYIRSLDSTIGAKAVGPDQTLSGKVTSTIRSVDESKGISKSATDYYVKMAQSPFGQKCLAFYSSTSKQILDIHEEARRIADQGKPSTAGSAPGEAATDTPIVTTTNTTGTEAPPAVETPPTTAAPAGVI